jgi:hypothetical protein
MIRSTAGGPIVAAADPFLDSMVEVVREEEEGGPSSTEATSKMSKRVSYFT